MVTRKTGRRPGVAPGASGACTKTLAALRVDEDAHEAVNAAAKRQGITPAEWRRRALFVALWLDR